MVTNFIFMTLPFVVENFPQSELCVQPILPNSGSRQDALLTLRMLLGALGVNLTILTGFVAALATGIARPAMAKARTLINLRFNFMLIFHFRTKSY
jgi:hypothetical protein